MADIDELLDLVDHLQTTILGLEKRLKRLERVIRTEVTFELDDDDDEES
jgi:hypothetical protein